MIFWTEDNFNFISDCRNSFNCKLKKFINEQIITFYSPSNALFLRYLPKKHLLQILKRFYGKLFKLELEILEIFTTAFLLKTCFLNLNFFSKQSAVLKNEKKNLLKRDANYLNVNWHSKRPKKCKKREKKKKKKLDNNNKHFFNFTFLYRKNYTLLENIFGKFYLILLHLYNSFFMWQVIKNAIIKHQHP